MYKRIIRPLLFYFDAERVHHLVCNVLKVLCKIPFFYRGLKKMYQVESPLLEREVLGLKFKNPVGLAAGFDKDAKMFKELSCFGFGFIEIGTLTPKPQSGNPKKRLFRLKEDKAIINRMGFNNEGVDAAVHRLKNRKNILIGGNIGKNKATPNENALSDYQKCFDVLFDSVDYFVVNVSSPNTPNLRALQEKSHLKELLDSLQEKNNQKPVPKPILLKIAPDLNESQLLDIIDIVQQTKIHGVVATNTTLSRSGLHSHNQKQTGGLSGKPLSKRSTEVIRFLHQKSGGAFPIIGVGGIHSEEDALEKIEAGASLVQLYTGFIYEGPVLIKRILKRIMAQEIENSEKKDE